VSNAKASRSRRSSSVKGEPISLTKPCRCFSQEVVSRFTVFFLFVAVILAELQRQILLSDHPLIASFRGLRGILARWDISEIRLDSSSGAVARYSRTLLKSVSRIPVFEPLHRIIRL
jgi:hypothetical protein